MTLHWKKLLPVAPATATIDGVLDAIYAALGAATYYDGSARTPGAGSAWTVSRFQAGGVTEAVYATPPAEYGQVQRLIWSGASGAKTPTMRAPDTWAINTLLYGVNKNSGAFNAWDAALPFTGGQWSGYWKGPSFVSTTIYVHVLECEEAVAVFLEGNTNACGGGFSGALWDPGSSAGLDCEADGRLYGLLTNGTGTFNADFLISTVDFMEHYNSASGAHAGCFVPGSSTWRLLRRHAIWGSAASASMSILPSGTPVTSPIWYRDSTSPYNFTGSLRGIETCQLSRTGRRLRVSGVDKAYIVGCSSIADNDSIALLTGV